MQRGQPAPPMKAPKATRCDAPRRLAAAIRAAKIANAARLRNLGTQARARCRSEVWTLWPNPHPPIADATGSSLSRWRGRGVNSFSRFRERVGRAKSEPGEGFIHAERG